MTDLRKAARWYAQRMGWNVLPLRPCEKLPAIKQWPKRATTETNQIERWWCRWSDANVGLACGPRSDVLVIDIDQHGIDGERGLETLQKCLGPLPATVEQRTGSGGRQLLYRYPEGSELRNKAGGKRGLPAGVDTRGAGGFVVLPPSIHPCGNRYRWTVGPHQQDLAHLPQAWIDALKKPAQPPRIDVPIDPRYLTPELGRNALDRICHRIATQTEGQRNATLYWGACRVADMTRLGTVVWSEAEPLLQAAGVAAGLDALEARKTVASARRAA